VRSASLIAFVCLAIYSAKAFADELPVKSPSFEVYSYRGGPTTESMLKHCQSLREELHKKWLGTPFYEPWEPCCKVVLHATRNSYIQAIGRGGIRSYGSSLIRSDGKRIAKRRIDLLANPDGQFTALTHELTHVILADRFVADHPPLWANEGIATLADSATKRSLHRNDCMAALRNGTSFRMIDLLQLDQFTSPHQVPAFYGQSLSLVQFLVERDEPSKFVPFLELAKEEGYDHALREVYDIDGVVQLETLWRDFAASGGKTSTHTSPHVSAGG
jgi:hypothetical protein